MSPLPTPPPGSAARVYILEPDDDGGRVGDVTVVVPTIEGREGLLARALASAAAQTTRAARIVVVTDLERRGAWFVRNIGAIYAQTTWLAWLDDDDELLPGHLELLLAGVRGGRVRLGVEPDLVYSYAEFPDSRDPLATVDDYGRLVPRPIGVQFGPLQEQWLRRMGNFIPVTYLVRSSLVAEVGGFPPSRGPRRPGTDEGGEEDYLLLVKLLDAGARFWHIPVRTWVYHVHDANTGGGWQGTGASNKDAFQQP